MIIPLDAAMAFDAIQHPFTAKVLESLGMQGIYLDIIKSTNCKFTNNINQNGEKYKASSIK